jgi:SpoVK/Ycf46/Vps4 family AAA+-type ATPase
VVEINQHDFNTAIKRIIPLSKRSGFATVPDTTWDDVGALHKVREELTNTILVSLLFWVYSRRHSFNYNSY